MRMLLADDHAILRKGLIQLLMEEFPEAQFGEASTTAETLDSLSQRAWDVLVLDIFMPGRGGLDVLQDVRRLYPSLPVLVLSSAPEEQLAARVLKAGAWGYLNKQAAPEELVKAIRKILAGGLYISAVLAERLAEELRQPAHRPLHDSLSDREFAVLRLLVVGKSVKAIASELSLSAKTISTYHTRIWQKLHVHNDIALIRYAIEHGLAGKAEG